jgi:hypothetical protein
VTRGTLLAGLLCRATLERALYHSSPLRRKAYVRWQRFRRLAILADTADCAAASPGNGEAVFVERLGNASVLIQALLMKIEK